MKLLILVLVLFAVSVAGHISIHLHAQKGVIKDRSLCNKRCPLKYKPVCGSDGKRHLNPCLLKVKACKKNIEIKVVPCKWEKKKKSNHCPKFCPSTYRPICALDGKKVKKFTNRCFLRMEIFCKKNSVKLVSCRRLRKNKMHMHKFVIKMKKNCPTRCPPIFRPVFASNGKKYRNVCQMLKAACRSGKKVHAITVGKLAYRRKGAVTKRCPRKCRWERAPVCGSDGKLYLNLCLMMKASCRKHKRIMAVGCKNISPIMKIKHINVRPIGCPKRCNRRRRPVCATGGKQIRHFTNMCSLRKEACRRRSVMLAFRCSDLKKKKTPNRKKTKIHIHIKKFKKFKLKKARCPVVCPKIKKVVCGSDNKQYDNRCRLVKAACLQRKRIKAVPCHGRVSGTNFLKHYIHELKGEKV